MGFFTWDGPKVTDKELADFRKGKAVRAKVAEEAVRRTADKKSAKAIRDHIKNGGAREKSSKWITWD